MIEDKITNLFNNLAIGDIVWLYGFNSHFKSDFLHLILERKIFESLFEVLMTIDLVTGEGSTISRGDLNSMTRVT